jgi:hypothetical protein
MRKPAVALLTILSLSYSACGDGTTPTSATPPAGVVATPTPTPKPTPTPVTLGLGVGCGLPVMPECGQIEGPPQGKPPGVWGCCTAETDNSQQFRSIISQSISKLQLERPSIFGSGNVVLDRVAYQEGVAQILERDYGVCAKPGFPGDEVAVKTTNDYSEQYDIYTQFQTAFNPPVYAVTCRPARF